MTQGRLEPTEYFLTSRLHIFYLALHSEFFNYLTELLESPERLGTHIFNQQRYATSAEECLQLYLCSHRNFSKGATVPQSLPIMIRQCGGIINTSLQQSLGYILSRFFLP